MLRILMALIPFAKELFFDRKEEMDFKSPYFNAKKWFQYVAFLLLFVAILFVGGRLFTISVKYIKLENDYTALRADLRVQERFMEDLKDDNQKLVHENKTIRELCGKPTRHTNGTK